MGDGAAEISVVIPAYNRESSIAVTLDSLLAQTYENWSALIVDDGSVDGTAEVADGYAGKDPRFRVVRQENRGVSAARNMGISQARGTWLFFLDADDWIVPTAFATLIATAKRGSDQADVAYGGYIRVDESGREIRVPHPIHDGDL